MENTAIKEVIKEAIKEGIGAGMEYGELKQQVSEHGRRITSIEECNRETSVEIKGMLVSQAEANGKLDNIITKINESNSDKKALRIAIIGIIGSFGVAILSIAFR